MDTFKVYINFYDSKGKHIEHEQKDAILKKIEVNKYGVSVDFGENKNKNQVIHYPLFYNDRFYFGSPVVLTNVTDEEIKKVIKLFKGGGFGKYWVTYKHRILSFDEVKKLKISYKKIRVIGNDARFIDNKSRIFLIEQNLVIPYTDGIANIAEA